MDAHVNSTTSTAQETLVVNPTLRERVTSAVKGIKVGAKTTLVVGGVLIAGGAYGLYRQTHQITSQE